MEFSGFKLAAGEDRTQGFDTHRAAGDFAVEAKFYQVLPNFNVHGAGKQSVPVARGIPHPSAFRTQLGVFFNQRKFDVCQLVGLDNISAGMDNFPMSWMEPAMRIPSILS